MYKAIDFSDPRLAYYFVSKLSSKLYDYFWVSIVNNGPEVILYFDITEPDLSKLDILKAESLEKLTYCKLLPDVEFRPEKAIHITELHREIKLERNDVEDSSDSYLVIPQRNSRPEDIRDIIGQICAQDEYEISILRTENPYQQEDDVYIFKLDSVDGKMMEAPLGLPNEPQILKCVIDRFYVPFGYSMPLLPNYCDFIVANEADSFQVWLRNDANEYDYSELKVKNIENNKKNKNYERLSSRISFKHFDENLVTQPISIGAKYSDIELELILREIKDNNLLRKVDKVIYSFESTEKTISKLFLRFLDFAEAFIDDFEYFCYSKDDSDVKIHYILSNQELPDDLLWVGIKKYVLLNSLSYCDLPVFIPDNMEFFPCIDGLLSGDNGNSTFVTDFRKRTGLTDKKSKKIVILENSSDGNYLTTTELSDGQMLIDAIKPILQDFNRIQNMKLYDVNEADFSEENTILNNDWFETAESDTQEIKTATESLTTELTTLTGEVDEDINRATESLIKYHEFLDEATAFLKELPSDFVTFINNVENTIRDVVEPRANWLREIDNSLSEIHLRISDKNKLEIDLQTKLSEDKAKTESLRSVLADAQENTAKAIDEADKLSLELEDNKNNLEELNERLQKVFEQKDQELENRKAEINKRVADIKEQNDILHNKEEKIKQQEEELTKEEEELANRCKELEEQEEQQRLLKEKLINENLNLDAKLAEIEKEKGNLEKLAKITPQFNEQMSTTLQAKDTEAVIEQFNTYLQEHYTNFINLNNKINKQKEKAIELQQKVMPGLKQPLSEEEARDFNRMYPVICDNIIMASNNIEIAKIQYENTDLVKSLVNCREKLILLQKKTEKFAKDLRYIGNTGTTEEHLQRYKNIAKELDGIRKEVGEKQELLQRAAWWLAWWLG